MMSWKIAFDAAALVGIALFSSFPSFAAQHQQPLPRLHPPQDLGVSRTRGVNTRTYTALVKVGGSLALGSVGTNSDDFGCATCGEYEIISPGDISVCDMPDPGLFVQRFNANGNQNNHPFHIQIQC